MKTTSCDAHKGRYAPSLPKPSFAASRASSSGAAEDAFAESAESVCPSGSDFISSAATTIGSISSFIDASFLCASRLTVCILPALHDVRMKKM